MIIHIFFSNAQFVFYLPAMKNIIFFFAYLFTDYSKITIQIFFYTIFLLKKLYIFIFSTLFISSLTKKNTHVLKILKYL